MHDVACEFACAEECAETSSANVLKTSSAALKIILTVRGVSNFKKKHHFHIVSQEECRLDFLLQETQSNQATENQWQGEWSGKLTNGKRHSMYY